MVLVRTGSDGFATFRICLPRLTLLKIRGDVCEAILHVDLLGELPVPNPLVETQ